MNTKSEEESICREIQQIILKVAEKNVDINEELLYAGLQSIEIFQIIIDINEEYSVDITFQEVMENNTILKIARMLLKKGLLREYENRQETIKDIPLTNIQKAYIVGRGSMYQIGNISTLFLAGLTTKVDPVRFEKAFYQLICKHEALRSIVTSKGKLNVLDEVPEYRVNYKDLSKCPAEEVMGQMEKIKNSIKAHKFSYNEWPMFRVDYIKCKDDLYYIFFCMDMVICDGTSIGVLLTQMDEILKKDIRWKDRNIASYSKYLVHYSDSKNTEADRFYWESQLDDEFLAPQIQIANKQLEQIKFNCLEYILDSKSVQKLSNMIEKKGITMSSFFAAAYTATLSEWSGQKYVVINIPINNRPSIGGYENTIGDFTNNILLKSEGKSDILKNAKEMQDCLYKHMMHQGYDGISFAKFVGKKRNTTFSEILFPYVYTPISMKELSNEKKLFELDYIYSQTTQVYLDFQMINTGNKVLLIWNYVNGLYDEDIIADKFSNMLNIVSGFLKRDQK